MHNVEWHQKNCPCKGKPQTPSNVLLARQKAVPNSGHYPDANGKQQFLFKPGSQNRHK